MGDDLGDLARLEAVVEREVQMARHLDRLVAGDERRERDDAAVPRREPRAFPEVPDRAARVLRERRGDRLHLLERRRARRGLRLVRLRRCRGHQRKRCECRGKTFQFDLLSVRSADTSKPVAGSVVPGT